MEADKDGEILLSIQTVDSVAEENLDVWTDTDKHRALVKVSGFESGENVKVQMADADYDSEYGVYQAMDPFVEKFNRLVQDFNEEYGVTLFEQGLVLSEETGELNEEVLKTGGGKLFKDNSDPKIREEVGQVIYVASTIAHLFNVDPFEAALEAAEENVRRED